MSGRHRAPDRAPTRPDRLTASARSRPAGEDAAEISEARDYYRRILPFYEKESLSHAHLRFWRSLAREIAPRRILEIGAGLGRITEELSRVAPAFGFDVSFEMLAAARRRNRGRARFLAADARRPTFGRAFDLIVAPGDPISHLTASSDRRRALRAVERQLSPDGRFVLEGLYRRRREIAPPSRRIRHADGVLWIDEVWSPVGARELWHARYRYRDERRDGSVATAAAAFMARAWNPASIRTVFTSCGLKIVELWSDFDRRPFSKDASRILVVARRAVSSGTRLAPLV